MNRPSFAQAAGLLLAVTLAGCGSAGTDRGATASPAAPSPGGTRDAASPATRIWGAGAAVSFPYGSFAEWARDAALGKGGIALVRITDVSPVQWSTLSGQQPGAADLALANQGEVEFTIGRLVTVQRVRVLRGTWTPGGDTALYWLPGGQIGTDRTPTYEGDARLNEPKQGALAVARLFAGTDMDGSDGLLFVTVEQLFPVDAAGRVTTFRSDEKITVGQIDSYLPAP